MITHHLFFVFFFLHSHPLFAGSLNISDLPHPHHSHFRQDVLKGIAVNQRWDIQTISVSKLVNVSFGYSKRVAFFSKIGKKRNTVIRFSDQVDSWNIFQDGGDFTQLVNRVNTRAVLRPFDVRGPCVLIVAGDDRLSLQLRMNTSSSLKQIYVGEGITVKLKGAKEVTFGMSSCSSDLTNRSNQETKGGINFWPLSQPMHLILVVGSAYVTPFGRHNLPMIHQRFVDKDIVELTPEKCYTRYINRKPVCPLNLDSRIIALKHLLKSLFGEFHRSLSFYKACIRAATIVQFQLELRRDVSELGKWGERRTQPQVQRLWFDVVASFDIDMLKPLKVKLVRPFIDIDSDSGLQSNQLSNISFTKYSNILVPPLPLRP